MPVQRFSPEPLHWRRFSRIGILYAACMGFGFYENGTYSPSRLRRIRLSIIIPAVLIIGGGAIAAAFGDFPAGNALGLAALVLVLASMLWWVTATKTSGPLKVSQEPIGYVKRILKGTGHHSSR